MIHEISISPASNGFIVRVGCQTLVYTGKDAQECADKLALDLRAYLIQPDETQQDFLKNRCFNAKHDSPTVPQHGYSERLYAAADRQFGTDLTSTPCECPPQKQCECVKAEDNIW